MTKVETTIPFSGFYESVHTMTLDQTLEEMFSNDRGYAISSLVEKASEAANWGGIFIGYSKIYVECLSKVFEIKTLEFKELNSPKEYNFTTDRIICDIDLEEVKQIFAKTNSDMLREKIRKLFTSRDGFISFYDNDLALWPDDLEEWDHNQIGTLLATYIEQVNGSPFEGYEEVELFAGSEEVFYEVINDNLEDCENLFKIYSYLREREDRKYRKLNLGA